MCSIIKKSILKKHIFTHKPVRQKQTHSLHDAKEIAMLCEITDEDSYKDIFRLFTRLQQYGCNVKLVGYIDDDRVPFYCLPQLATEYFCKKQLNWYGLPDRIHIRDFLDKDYDMLIDFNYRHHSATESILSLSKAKFIIGREAKCQHLYDLYLNTNLEDNEKFLNVVDIYTRKLTGND